MASRAKVPCGRQPCPNLADPKVGYCDNHKAVVTRQYDKDRGSAHARGYDRAWQKIRRAVLMEEPLCRHCTVAGRLTPAEHVDHIDGDVTNMSRENLQPLCQPCHGRKTVREQGAFGNPKRRNDP